MTFSPLATLIIAGALASAPLATQGAAQAAPPQGPAQRSPTPGSTTNVVRVDTVASGLQNPWALEFLPDGRMLVSEKGSGPGRGGSVEQPGQLRIVDPRNGRISPPLTGVPTVAGRGQGGLLDVALDPQFATNRLVYVSFSEPGEANTSGTSVARGRLTETGLENVQMIYQQRPKVVSNGHFGSRLVFGRDGMLFITQGDRQAPQFRRQAQDLSNGFGKLMRINPDGTIPRDNPFASREDALPEIWSYGHRNVQGATLHPQTGQLWTIEHGPRGGDELNRPEPGKNYGWPVIGYGIDYPGTQMHESAVREGMEQPVYYWDPVIAPGGMTFYTGDRYPGWNGSLLIGGLESNALVRLAFDESGRVTGEERYLGELRTNIRDVKQGPDGYVYIIGQGRGQIYRVVPVTR
jgi:glucose/arabinose dehydrogenase